MIAICLAPDPAWPTPGPELDWSSVAVAFVVLAVLAALAWAVRRRWPGLFKRRALSSIAVERAISLGERRSLAIVSVEGRRLLLGLTPVQVSLLAELPASPPRFEQHLDRSVGPTPGSPS
jgi:flagellar biogenesis protein FliO